LKIDRREARGHRYAEFFVDVYASSDAVTRQGQPADDAGVRWEHVPPDDRGNPAGWIAQKVFGNVALVWLTKERQLTREWRTLDAALTALRSGTR
jgi:hypothetical protein